MNLMDLFGDAENDWELEILYQDLAFIKGNVLTDLEKACLRGLLCLHNPKVIASQIGWQPSSLRTELSKGLYSYIANRIGIGRILWYRVGFWLEEAGYKRSSANQVNADLLNLEARLSQNSNVKATKASDIIASVEQQLLNLDSTVQKENEISSALEAKLNHLIEQGDKHSKQRRFINAIKFYRESVEVNPFLFPGVFIKIAICFDQLSLFMDSLSICYFALDYVKKSEHKNQLYILLAGVFHELARHNNCDLYLERAIFYYKQAHIYSS